MESLLVVLKKKKRIQPAVGGFTLVEMLVVLSIIVIVTSIALFGQTTYNRTLLLTNTAYSVAFSIRQAQFFGLSSRIYGGISDAGYGIHFASVNPPGTGGYYLFADLSNPDTPPSTCPLGESGTPEAKPGNCLYDYNDTSPPMDAVAQTYQFDRSFTVDRFCGRELTSGTERCSNSAGTGYLERLNIVFTRPNTETIITGIRSTGTLVPLRDASIFIKAPEGDERSICVSLLGQVYVALTTCS